MMSLTGPLVTEEEEGGTKEEKEGEKEGEAGFERGEPDILPPSLRHPSSHLETNYQRIKYNLARLPYS